MEQQLKQDLLQLERSFSSDHYGRVENIRRDFKQCSHHKPITTINKSSRLFQTGIQASQTNQNHQWSRLLQTGGCFMGFASISCWYQVRSEFGGRSRLSSKCRRWSWPWNRSKKPAGLIMFDLYGCEFLLDVLEGLNVDRVYRVDFGCGAVFAFTLRSCTKPLRDFENNSDVNWRSCRGIEKWNWHAGCDAVAYHVIHVASCY